MQTRSQTKQLVLLDKGIYDVIIDFDGASEAWKSNKKSIGNGSYKYVCQKKGIKGNTCNLKCLHGEDYCKRHSKSILIREEK